MSLMEQLTQVVAAQMAGQAAKQTGMAEGVAAKMMPMAIAAVMAGMKKNAANPQGAQALSNALDKHDGGLLDNLSQLTGGDMMADGQKILGHVLGGKQAATQQALAKTAGVDQGQIGQLMAMAAPAVMAALGKAKREQGLDVSALTGLVNQESQVAQKAAPNEMGGLLSFLDQDGDGDVDIQDLSEFGNRFRTVLNF